MLSIANITAQHLPLIYAVSVAICTCISKNYQLYLSVMLENLIG